MGCSYSKPTEHFGRQRTGETDVRPRADLGGAPISEVGRHPGRLVGRLGSAPGEANAAPRLMSVELGATPISEVGRAKSVGRIGSESPEDLLLDFTEFPLSAQRGFSASSAEIDALRAELEVRNAELKAERAARAAAEEVVAKASHPALAPTLDPPAAVDAVHLNTTSKTILIDMDNTICDFDAEVVRRFSERFPGQTMLSTSSATRRNWGIAEDLDDPFYKEEVKKIFRATGFTESLPPIAGAVDALKQMLAEGHDVRLCTSPLVNQPMGVGEKFVWVAAVLGDEWKKRIVITSDKTLVKGRMLIDDKMEIVDKKSACTPEWRQCVPRPPVDGEDDSLPCRPPD